MMPRFLRGALVFALPLLLCACTGKQADVIAPQLDSAFTAQAEMEYEGGTADFSLTRLAAGQWEAEFSQPPALAGVRLSFDGNAVGASYKGLAFTVPKSAMPAKTVLIAATDLLDTLTQESELPCIQLEDGTAEAAGICDAGSYTVRFDSEGRLCGMRLPDQPMTLRITDYRVTVSEETTCAETTVTESTVTESTVTAAETTGT